MPRTERTPLHWHALVGWGRIELQSEPGRLATLLDRSHDPDRHLGRVTLRSVGPDDSGAQYRRSARALARCWSRPGRHRSGGSACGGATPRARLWLRLLTEPGFVELRWPRISPISVLAPGERW